MHDGFQHAATGRPDSGAHQDSGAHPDSGDNGSGVPGADAPGTHRRPAGALEAEVLAVLRAAREPLNPGQVRDRLAAPQQQELSYSTVVTILSRLHAKGLLARERAGRGFAYAPLDPASVAAGQMSRALDGGGDHNAVLSRFVSGLSGRDARMLRRLLTDEGAEPEGG